MTHWRAPHNNIDPEPFLCIAILGVIVLCSIFIGHVLWRVA